MAEDRVEVVRPEHWTSLEPESRSLEAIDGDIRGVEKRIRDNERKRELVDEWIESDKRWLRRLRDERLYTRGCRHDR